MTAYFALRQEWIHLRGSLLEDTSLTAVEHQAVVHLDSVSSGAAVGPDAPVRAESDGPGGGADSLRGPQALVALFAQQLGGLRTVLGPMAQGRFDPAAWAWLARRAQAGQRVTIAGVGPRPRCGFAPAVGEYNAWGGLQASQYGAAVDRRQCAGPRRGSRSSP